MDIIIIIDFGSQYSHLISRRIRDLGIYAEVVSADTDLGEILQKKDVKGLILSGGAASVMAKNSPKYDKKILAAGVPVLGICYGHQLIAYLTGAGVEPGSAGEYGTTFLKVNKSALFTGLGQSEKVWMNHKDTVKELPRGFTVIGATAGTKIAAFENAKKNIFGVQFHPEVTHTPQGSVILKNFTQNICQAKPGWASRDIVHNLIKEAQEKIGDNKAIIGLSGGVDSSTAAIILSKAIGDQLTAVYVDTGLMRYKETEFIKETFSRYGLNLKIIHAEKDFFDVLKGITAPEQKRKIIGKKFIAVFNKTAKEVGATVLVQGTIYSDRIESGLTKNSSTIKSHHNVGGLPKEMPLKIYEPLKDLYKDEVRKIARQIGLPADLVKRKVFPGPGLAIRLIGEVTPKRAEIVRKASYIVEKELQRAGLYDSVWMAFAVLLPIKSVGIQGDARSYKYPIVVRVVESKDAMTANYAKIPYAVLDKISTRITNEIKDVNRVVYDISNKPPATMEWE